VGATLVGLPEVQAANPTDGMEPEVPQQDNSEANENIAEILKTNLLDLARKFTEEDRYSRRLEIQETRRKHFFWRELQHLTWDYRTEGWQVLGQSSAGLGTTAKQQDSSVLYTTNIYQGFGLSIQAVLTQNIPAVRFEPQNPSDAADIETAKAANRMRKIIEHENDAVKLMTETAFLCWNDGRIGAYTRFQEDKRTKTPRETISVCGVLELKVPITADSVEDYVYLQHSNEYHEAIIKDEVSKMAFEPGYEKKIKTGSSGAGQDVYERTARISTKQGVSLVTQSVGSWSHLVTRQNTWMRPAAFKLIENEEIRAQLEELFPDGFRVRSDSGTYTGSWNESMDDCWAILHPLPGDGQYRNSIGNSSVSVQERFNDIINITQDVYEKTQPAGWFDDKIVDADGVVRQRSMPGARYPAPRNPQEALSNSFYFEPAAQVSADMLQYAQDLMGPVMQFLTGAFPALFGGEMKGVETASGYGMARDQAMGRIGLIWRAVKRFWARIMEQAVRCAAKNRKDDVSMGVPDDSGNVETTEVRIEELQGKIYCYPDSDENFPESFSQKRAAYMQILPIADKNPALEQILAEPDNVELARKLIGLEDFVIPAAEARDKQLYEINQMLKSAPTPNPQYAQLQEELGQATQHVGGGGMLPDGAVEALTQQLQSTGQMTSSIPIDAEMDDNAAEAEAGKTWVNSSEGQKQKRENPTGFANVRFHILEHLKVVQQQEMAQMMAAMPPPKVSTPPGTQTPGPA